MATIILFRMHAVLQMGARDISKSLGSHVEKKKGDDDALCYV